LDKGKAVQGSHRHLERDGSQPGAQTVNTCQEYRPAPAGKSLCKLRQSIYVHRLIVYHTSPGLKLRKKSSVLIFGSGDVCDMRMRMPIVSLPVRGLKQDFGPGKRIQPLLQLLLSILASFYSDADGTAAASTDHSATRHPFLYAGEWDTRKPYQSIFLVREGKVRWQYSVPLRTASGGVQEFDDATQLSNGNIIFSRMSGAGEITPEKNLVWEYAAPPGTEVHSIQWISEGRMLVMRNGNPPKAILFNTSSNRIEKEIIIPCAVTNTHVQFRHIRMTKAGTLLVPHLGEGKVVEYDLDGKPLWSVEAKSPWSAVRLRNGNTLIAGDWSRYAREVNSKGETIWEFTPADLPGEKLGNIQTASRLANGNTVMCCWIAGDSNTSHWPGTVQVLEVTPAKGIVWALSSWDNPDLGPATSIQLLDQPGPPEDAER
jgi:hypothetical protein